jgi:signal recognition particle subunit SRP19
MTQAEAAAQRKAAVSSSSSSSTAPPSESQPIQMQNLDPAIKQAMKQWTCVYPVYLDAGKSVSEGRRIPKSAGLTNPSIVFLGECCRQLQLNHVVEMFKRHPRDPLTYGRVRVQIKATGGPFKPTRTDIKSKFDLLLKIAAVYPDIEAAMKKANPVLAAQAAASRQEMSKLVEETYKEATKEIKEKEEGGSSKSAKKKNKKK